MGKNKMLTEEEKAKVQVLKAEGYNGIQISEKLGRSKNVIYNYLRDPENYGKNYKGGIKTATTERERRKIQRIASNSTLTARQIGNEAGSSASVWTIRRIIKSSPHLKRLKLQKKPLLTRGHQENRLLFARNHLTWTDEWKSVVFSDEKRFCLDGPDGFAFYYHDLRKEKHYLARRHNRERGIMVWGAITYQGPIQLRILEGHQNAEKYAALLQRAFADIDEVLGTQRWIFQQDNAAIHTARAVKDWFRLEDIDVLQWPAHSPDLNIIENLWGWLSRQIYANGKQYESVKKLQEAVTEAWNRIPLALVHSLYESINNRLFEVVRNDGKHTHY